MKYLFLLGKPTRYGMRLYCMTFLVRFRNTWIFYRVFSAFFFVMFSTTVRGGPGSSISIATDYGLEGSGSNPGGDEVFFLSKLALELTQPPVKWVPGLSRGVKCGRGVLLTTHPLLIPRSWNIRAITLPTLWSSSGL